MLHTKWTQARLEELADEVSAGGLGNLGGLGNMGCLGGLVRREWVGVLCRI